MANTFLHCTKIGLKHFAVSLGRDTLDVYGLDGSPVIRIDKVVKFAWIKDLLEYITIVGEEYTIKEARF